MKLIGLAGLAGSGKDTVGQYIEEAYDFATISFADSLKDCLASIFGWERPMLEGRTSESRKWREQVDEWWADRLGIPHFTPRFAMTNFGTDVMRKWFHDDIWILNTERRLMATPGPVVITDLRFPNEFAMTRRLGGQVFRVMRGPEPKWRQVALDAIRGDAIARERMHTVFRIHESEWVWMAEKPDAYIVNDSDLPELYGQVDRLIGTRVVPDATTPS